MTLQIQTIKPNRKNSEGGIYVVQSLTLKDAMRRARWVVALRGEQIKSIKQIED